MIANLERLGKQLEYAFTDAALLEQALTHRSAGANNNERLEFLGDAVLGAVIAEALYQQFPEAPEGDLSRLRASLVKKSSLASIARELNLGDYLVLGSGELKSGGYRRDSILADAVEAIFGAVYLDAGFQPARELILRQYQSRLAAIPSADSLKDPKTRLQEYLQSRQLELPDYEVTAITGEAHNQNFAVQCAIAEKNLYSEGQGRSRRKAEQAAAQAMLELLEAES